MKKSVGLVLIINTKGGLRVALQRRGAQDSFPGACQVSVHGKLEGDEDFYKALIRESCEELGEVFTHTCQKDIELVELFHQKFDDKEIVTYGALVPEDRLDLIRLERTSGGINVVEGGLFFDGTVIDITSDKKKEGYPPTVIAVFGDEIQAIKKALEIFAEQSAQD